MTTLVNDREEMLPRIGEHLRKSKLSYKDAVEAIRDRDEEEPIPKDLGDFILAAISIVIRKPILVVKPVIETTKDPNGRTTTVYNCKVEYLFDKDRKKTTGSDIIVMVYNGLDYYSPAVPKEIAKLTSGASIAKTFLNDAIKEVQEVFDSLPPSESRQSLTQMLRFMGAAKDCLAGTRLTSGTAAKTNIAQKVPLPQPMPSTQTTKMARKRAASALKVVPPTKEKNETDEQFAEKKKKYNDALSKEEKRYCKMAPTQCYCGKEFDTKEVLQVHMRSEHTDSGTWQCPECDAIIGSGPKLWTHVRHHWGRWYFYCDVEFKDKDDCDKDGKPKKKICTVTTDERSYIEYHREVDHSVGETKIRCKWCKKPQMTKRHKLAHEDICEEGNTEKGVITDKCPHCEYGARGRSTIRNHIRQKHWEILGLPAPPTYECSQCGKTFTTLAGSKKHECKVNKPKKNPSAAKGKRKLHS